MKYWVYLGMSMIGAVSLSSIGCSSSDEVCAAYACLNTVQLSGNIELASDSTATDVRICLDDQCRDGALDIVPNSDGARCAHWPASETEATSWNPPEVCLTALDDTGTAHLSASWDKFSESTVPRTVQIQVVLSDHGSSAPLLDETRTASVSITREDSCHQCWTANAAL